MNTLTIVGIILLVVSHFLVFLGGFAKGLSANLEDVKKCLKEAEDKENSD